MYEFELYLKDTDEYIFTYGYNYDDMLCRNPGLKDKNFKVISKEYID